MELSSEAEELSVLYCSLTFALGNVGNVAVPRAAALLSASEFKSVHEKEKTQKQKPEKKRKRN